MGQIKPFYGTGYATGTYNNLYNTYLTAYWLASGNAMANITCTGTNEVLLDLSIPTPTHFYDFNANLLDSAGSSHGSVAYGSSSYVWSKHGSGANATANWYANNMATNRLPASISFWSYFTNIYLGRQRTLFANVTEYYGGDLQTFGLYRVYVDNTNKIGVKLFNGITSTGLNLTGVNTVVGDWQFHTVLIDSTNKRVGYSTNGSGLVWTSFTGLAGTINSTVNLSGSIMGAWEGPTGIGRLDSVGFFNTLLTEKQIKALWFGGSGKYYSGGWRQ